MHLDEIAGLDLRPRALKEPVPDLRIGMIGLGRFADAEIASLADDELAQLERLIEVPDPDLYAAMTGDKPLPPEYANGLFDRIKSFRSVDHNA